MTKLISVIVPVYNVEKYIDRCVDSIRKQTYQNLEIILVDDGSTDNCPSICDKYKNEDERIVVIHKKNGGLSDARNYGLNVATGEFVIFVDSDDYIDLDLCQTLINNFDDGIDIIQYGFRRFYDENEEIKNNNAEVIRFEKSQILINYIKRNHITHMVCDKAFRKELFNENVRFIKGRLAEDLAICYLLVEKANGLKSITKSFYNYYTRSNSIMGTGSLKLIMDAFQGELETYEHLNKRYPELQVYNDERLLNQSMKVYLKLLNRYELKESSAEVAKVKAVISSIDRSKLSIKTKAFYLLININKDIAWTAFKMLKLS